LLLVLDEIPTKPSLKNHTKASIAAPFLLQVTVSPQVTLYKKDTASMTDCTEEKWLFQDLGKRKDADGKAARQTATTWCVEPAIFLS
jgi:hypothetical protein